MVLGKVSEKTFVFRFELLPDVLVVFCGAMISQVQNSVTSYRKCANFLSYSNLLFCENANEIQTSISFSLKYVELQILY
jgi:hypothetical protein